jgi:hypothetical protein
MPELLHQYFLSDFDLPIFKLENECLIRKKIIDDFVKSATFEEKKLYICDLVYDYNDILKVHDEYPKEKLVETFGKYLKQYLTIQFSLQPSLKHKMQRELTKELLQFKNKHPCYGRKILTIS